MRVLAGCLFHGDFVRGRAIIRAPSAVWDSKERDKKFLNMFFPDPRPFLRFVYDAKGVAIFRKRSARIFSSE